MRVISVLIILLSLSIPVPGYRSASDDRKVISTRDVTGLSVQLSFPEENKLFSSTGICASNNRSHLGFCKSNQPVTTPSSLQQALCFCDELCHYYHDCCLDTVYQSDGKNREFTCKVVRTDASSRIPMYVIQSCPQFWEHNQVKTMCELDAETLEKEKQSFSHLQDIPVLSKTSGIFYSNVYCAVCNGETDLVKWHSIIHCNGDSVGSSENNEEDYDFSNAVYNTRDQNFQRVKVKGKVKRCRLIIRDFRLQRLLELGGRLCKPVTDTCMFDIYGDSQKKCKAYSSFVYEELTKSTKRIVYKNFHCALCNGASIDKLKCLDPEYPILHTTLQTGRGDLSWLFDFNFLDERNQVGNKSPCRLNDGQLWDPVFKKCQNFTCGALYVRDGGKCLPRNFTGNEIPTGLKRDCPKRILSKDMFILSKNGSFYVNESTKLLLPGEYEVHTKNGDDVTQIAVCAEELYMLPSSSIYMLLSEITLSISIICLILHLGVYVLLKELRNRPGKILMSLSSSLLCGHFFLLTGSHFANVQWLCYIAAIATHFGYIASFLWMNVMAFDIHRTFTATQSRHLKHQSFFMYSLYSWISAMSIIALSITLDNTLDMDFEFRPKYGDPICWFNNKKGLLVFFVIPVLGLVLTNIIFFSITAFYLNKISRQTKMVNNFSDRTRYFLYIKLSVVLGLAWMLGFFAGITGTSILWYPFIILNGLQGVFIFISFTIKRKIIHKLLVIFKIRSSSYKMGKQSALKKAMYSSLSNLSTLGTTLTTQVISAVEDKTQMLKSVRKINPDAVL